MKNNKVFILAVVVAAIAGFYLVKSNFQAKKVEEIKATASSDLVKPHSPTLWPSGARVQLVEFLDPECESCRMMEPIVKALLKEYEGKIQLVVRYMPFHGNSLLAACALEEARERGRYWEGLSALFERQPEWGDHHSPRPDLIPVILRDAGVSVDAMVPEQIIEKHRWKVDLDYADGQKLGVRGTPTFFVNGKMLFDIGYEPIKMAIEEALK